MCTKHISCTSQGNIGPCLLCVLQQVRKAMHLNAADAQFGMNLAPVCEILFHGEGRRLWILTIENHIGKNKKCVSYDIAALFIRNDEAHWSFQSSLTVFCLSVKALGAASSSRPNLARILVVVLTPKV